MSTTVSTRILRLQAISPRYSPVNLGQGLTATWADLANRPANLAALAGSEAIKNGDITVDANGRITGIGTGALTKVANNQITIDASGNLVGIGSGDSTTVANGSITIDGNGRIVGIGSGALTAIANSVINITAGQLQGIGAGAGTTVANSSISIDADGRISGVGTGNLTSVSNTVLSLSTGGQLTYSSSTGPVNLGSTTLSGLGAGAFATLNQLSAANIATFVAANAIGSTYIGSVAADKITAGTLVAGVVYAGSVAASQITAGSLAAGVIYTGTLSASQVNAGTFTGLTFQTASSGTRVVISGATNDITCFNGSSVVEINKFSSGGVYANTGSTLVSAIAGVHTGALPGVSGQTSTGIGVSGGVSTTSAGHGVRGASAGAGLVGVSSGGGSFAFYAQSGGYGPFTGSHDALISKDQSVEVGDIVADNTCVAKRGVSDTLFEVEPAVSCIAIGVAAARNSLTQPPTALCEGYDKKGNPQPVAEFDVLQQTHDRLTINALGEGQINVCGLGGNLQPGDLIITSSIPGKGMRQTDDVIRSSTVAKCREAVSFSDPNEVKMVACIYLCG